MASEASNLRKVLAQGAVTANGLIHPPVQRGRVRQRNGSHQQGLKALASRLPLIATLLSVVCLVFSGCGSSTHPTLATISFPNGTITTLAPGAVTALSAAVTNDSENLGVDWSVTCVPPVGSTLTNACGSFAPAHTASGAYTNYTAPNAVPTNASVTITATSTTDPTRTTSLVLSISGPTLTISISPATANVEVNSQANFTAIVANDPANAGVNWSLSCGTSSGLVCGTLSATQSSSGNPVTYTAPAASPGSPVTLTATSVTNPTITSTAAITVVPAITVGFLTVPPAILAPGGSVSLTALVTNDFASAGVTWTATAGTFSATQTASGVATTYTAPAVAAGTVVTITAASVTDPTKTVTANITVEYNVSVAISSAVTTLAAGSSASFTATVINDGANGGVNWTASAGTFSPVHTASGVATTYTAPSSIPAGGTVTITATSSTDSTKSATATVTITSAAISVAIAPLTATVQVGTAAGFVAVVTNDPNNKGVTWTATAGTITPSQTASGAATIFTAPTSVPSGGTVTITATSVADPTKSTTATVTISTTAPPISVVISPSTVTVAPSGTQNFTATVSNDSSNGGVNWTTTGGTISPTQTASGASTVFTAPGTAPTGGTITITATSVTDPTKSATATVTVATPNNNALLNGQYAFSMSGVNPAGGQLQAVYEGYLGSITADGNGHITTGEVDYSSPILNSPANVTPLTGTYTIDQNGHGTIVLSNSTANYSLTLSLSMISPSHGLVASAVNELSAGGSGVFNGTIDLQTPSAFTTLSGSYALTFAEFVSAGTFDFGGTIVISNQAITSYSLDENGQFGVTPPSLVTANDTIGAPDSNGRGVFTPSAGPLSGFPLIYYVVDSTHVLLGGNIQNGTGVGAAYLEPSAPLSSLAGTYAFTETTFPDFTTGDVVAGGIFTCDASGNLTLGTLDVNNAGTFTTGAITGTCALDSPADGRGTITITNGASGGVSSFAVYPAANNSLLLFDTDTTLVGSGVAYPQTSGVSASTFTGSYAAGFADYTTAGNIYSTLLGDITASGTTALSGTVDIINTDAGQVLGATVTGSSSLVDTGNGRLTGEFTTSPTTGGNNAGPYDLTNIFYVVDANTVLTLESDTVQGPGTGILQLQNFSAAPNLRTSRKNWRRSAKQAASVQQQSNGDSVKENR